MFHQLHHKTKAPSLLERRRSFNQATQHLDNDTSQHGWLAKVENLVNVTDDTYKDISWSAHFASSSSKTNSKRGLLPLFRDNVHSIAMVRHGMHLIRKSQEKVYLVSSNCSGPTYN